MATIPEALQTAIQHQQAGRLQAAEQLYRQILNVDPKHADALHLLGIILSLTDRLSEAAASIRSAITAIPNAAAFHNTLGNVLQEQGQIDAAVESYRRAHLLQPATPHFHYNLGTALQERGQSADAVKCYEQALQLQPDYVEAHYNLANALKDRGLLDEAIIHYRQVVKLWPGFPDAYNNLGAALQEQGHFDEAADCFRNVLQLTPDCTVAHYNLACLFQELGQLDDAHKCLSRVLQLQPEHAQAYITRGNTLKSQGQMSEAIKAYRKAVEIQPDNLIARQNLLYSLHFSPDYSAREILAEHLAWQEWYGKREPRPNLKQSQIPAVDTGRIGIAQSVENSPVELVSISFPGQKKRRLRIGYVSADFRNHATSLFTTSLLSQHNHDDFEIYCYSGVRSPNRVTKLIQSYADHWREIAGLDDIQAADLIQQDQIDILLDLSMHMANNRIGLFARKPAPVQICWVAYPGTTGLAAMDYRLTDPYIDPIESGDDSYSEVSIRLPDSFWCYSPLTDQPLVNPLPALSKGHLTFGSLNDFCKTNPQVFRLWARTMLSFPDSRLMLLASEGSHREQTLAFFESEGISRARITFVRPRPRESYLEYYRDIDIGLDTFPYNGHTTSFDSFWMGVPVVTLVGQTVVGRAGACLLHNLGLPELIAHSNDEFTLVTKQLASDLPRLSRLRSELRQRLENSPLMDAERFAKNVEAVYWQVWKSKP